VSENFLEFSLNVEQIGVVIIFVAIAVIVIKLG
jgi:hypothetical protein